jgi:hypothetical protein
MGVGEGVAVGGGVDVLVGVGVGDGLPAHPTSNVDKSSNALDMSVSKVRGSVSRDTRRTIEVRLINGLLLLAELGDDVSCRTQCTAR